MKRRRNLKSVKFTFQVYPYNYIWARFKKTDTVRSG